MAEVVAEEEVVVVVEQEQEWILPLVHQFYPPCSMYLAVVLLKRKY